MKKSGIFYAAGVVLFLSLAIFFGCSDSDSVTGDDGDTANTDGNGTIVPVDTRDAYETVIEFAVAKQIMLYEYLEVMTDDYTAGFMENDLTYEKIDRLFSSIYSLMEYEQAVENALAVIESDTAAKPTGTMAVEGLANSMKNFFIWATGSGTRSRNRILQVASNMSEHERTFLYNNLRSNWKSGFSDENDFWKKMEDGELDYKAPQMFNDFHHLADSEFGAMSSERGLTINKIAHREGAEGVKHGAQLMVDVLKTAAPATAKGMDLVEKADEYRDKAKKAFIDPVGFIKDEAKSKIAGKIGEYTDVDGAVDGGLISEDTGTALKAFSDFTFGTDDPTQLASQGIDWGVAQIKQASGSTEGPDVAVAQSGDTGTVPETVIAMGSKTQNINVVLPQGKWDVKIVNPNGTTKDHENKDVKTGEVTEIEADFIFSITISPSSAESETGSAVSYTASVNGTPPENAMFEWDFGDGSSPMGMSWNAIMSRTYSEAGTYTVRVRLKDESGKILAEDTAEAVIADASQTSITSYLHTLKSVYIVFRAALEGDDGTQARTIVIDTRNYSSEIVWTGLSFKIDFSDGETYGTISGRFTDEKYKLQTLDAVVHEVDTVMEYVDGWAVGSVTWEFDKDILVENLSMGKYTQYGINGLYTTLVGSSIQQYIGTVNYTESFPDDPDDEPTTFSSVDWENKDDAPELDIYFFDN